MYVCSTTLARILNIMVMYHSCAYHQIKLPIPMLQHCCAQYLLCVWDHPAMDCSIPFLSVAALTPAAVPPVCGLTSGKSLTPASWPADTHTHTHTHTHTKNHVLSCLMHAYMLIHTACTVGTCTYMHVCHTHLYQCVMVSLQAQHLLLVVSLHLIQVTLVCLLLPAGIG